MGNLFACLLIYLVILCVVLLHSLLLSTCPSISYTIRFIRNILISLPWISYPDPGRFFVTVC